MPKERGIKALSRGFIFRDDLKRMVLNFIGMSDLWEIENLEEHSNDILMPDVWVISV
jgi:hypothetical protein